LRDEVTKSSAMTSKALFDIPPGATAQVSIIDPTFRLSNMPMGYLLTPGMDGFDTLDPLTTWSFLVQSSTGQRALFDLGVPPDINTFSPAVVQKLKASGWTVEAKQHVADILKENGVDPAEIGDVIWSHWHWDHIGDPSTFPGTTNLVVGPGFKDAFYPGYPAKPDAPVKESDFK
jgi:glyoxylase-like metal-dependent hydrolase (beta-lactamase superfamily II)